MYPSRSQGHTNVVALSLAVRWCRCKLIAASFVAMVFLLMLASQVGAQTTSGNSTTGQSLFTNKGCINCHAPNAGARVNAINAGGHIEHARTQGMLAQTDATGQEYNDIAAYLATLFPVQGTQSIAHNTATSISIPNIVLNTAFGDYVGLRTTAGGQARGAAVFTVGSTLMTYTPTTGQCGADTINYEAYRTINSGTSNLRSLSVSIANPAAPNITTSASSANGVIGSAFTYTPVSSGGAVGVYDISSGTLPAGLGINTSSGAITGTPSGPAGTSNVTLRGSNCLDGALSGQSSTRNIAITINTPSSAPAITSPASANFTEQSAGTFNVTASGSPAPTFSASGVRPSGVTLSSSGVLSGTPALGSAGSYPLTITASNGVAPDATQNFTLTVVSAGPGITFVASPATVSSGGSATLTWNSNGTNCTASGAWSGVKASAGSQVLTSLSVTGAYTLTCSGAGGSASQTVTISVSG